jgi:predicted MFS family arabinose efflux permease
MFAGMAALWGSPVLRAISLLVATVNSVGATLGLVAIVILKGQSVSPVMIGVALSGAAVGGLAGATLVKPLHRLPPGVLLIVACAFEVPVLALLALPYGPWWMAGLLFVAMLSVPALRVLLDVLILRQAPEHLRGRMVGALMTMMSIGMPVGLAVGGLLLQYLSVQATVLILAGLLAAGVLYCGMKPELWRARWPQ